MINQIELENWKTHGLSRISFTRGTNILIGQMGAGKSSVLDAISFALFGTFPSIQHRRVNVSEIIRNRPVQKESASVTLDFTMNGADYSVKRSISRNGMSKAQLEKNGEYVQSQPQRVNEEIEKILKVDYDLFSKAIYSEQNSLDYFLDLRPTERKKQIDELLGLDKFALAQENVTSVMNKIKDLAEENEKTAAGFDIDKLKDQLNSLKQELEALGKEKEKVEKAFGEVSKRREEQEKELSELKEHYQRKTKLEQEIASAKSKAEMLSKEIEKIESMKMGDERDLAALVAKARKDVDEKERQVKELREEWQKEQTTFSNFSAELNKARKEKTERDRLLGEQKKNDKRTLEQKLTEANAALEGYQRDLAEHTALRNENSKWIKELEKHIKKCPVCERDLDEATRRRLLNDRESSVKGLEQMIKEMTSKVEREKAGLEKFTASLNQCTVIDEKIKQYGDIDAVLARLEASAKKSQEEAEKLKALSDSANDSLSRKSRDLLELTSKGEEVARRKQYLVQREEVLKGLKSMVKERDSIKTDQTKLDRLQDALIKQVSDASRLSANLDSYQKSEKDKNVQIKDKDAEIKRVDTLYDDVKRKKAVAENLTRFKVSLQETQAVLRTKLIDSINNIMQEVWPDLYPYGDYVNIMMDATADDYVLKVMTRPVQGGGDWHDVEAIASGGERSIACLAMRIAFSLVLSPTLRWLILDEPTHNIDQQGLERFIRMFNEVLPRIVDQTFIITHDPILRQAYNSKVYMLSRNKDEDKETVIEEV